MTALCNFKNRYKQIIKRLNDLSYYSGCGLLQLGFFTYYSVSTGELNPAGPVPIDSIFIYRPDKRIEIWRFLLYMMLHAG